MREWHVVGVVIVVGVFTVALEIAPITTIALGAMLIPVALIGLVWVMWELQKGVDSRL